MKRPNTGKGKSFKSPNYPFEANTYIKARKCIYFIYELRSMLGFRICKKEK